MRQIRQSEIYRKLEDSLIAKRFISGSFWSILGAVLSRGLMLIASIIVARIIGKTEYGELGIIRSTVTMFSVFAGFGLGLTATKYIAEFRDKEPEVTGKIIAISTIFAVMSGAIISMVILLYAPYLSNNILNSQNLSHELQLSAIMLFFSALNGAQTGILTGFEAFKKIAKINVISGAISFPVQILTTYLWGLQGAVIGFGTNYFILYLLNKKGVQQITKKHKINISYVNCWSQWRVLYKFSLPAVFSGLLVTPVMWFGNAILVNQQNGYDEMAIFDAANQWRNAILFLPTIISQILLPLLANSNNNKLQFKKLLKYSILTNFSITSIIAITISGFSGLIMKSYGSDFYSGRNVLIILVFTTTLIATNSTIGQAIASKGKMWIGFLLNSIWAIVMLSTSYILLTNGYGAKGLAIAYLISYFIHTLNQFIVLKFNILK